MIIVVSFIKQRILWSLTILSNVDPVTQLTFGALSQVWKEICKAGDDAEISACAGCSLGFD